MTLRFSCPACGANLAVPDSMAGRKGKCKKCGADVNAPQPSPSSTPVATASTPQQPLWTEARIPEPAGEPAKAGGSAKPTALVEAPQCSVDSDVGGFPVYAKYLAIAVGLIVVVLIAYIFLPHDTWEQDNAAFLASAKGQAEAAFARGDYDRAFAKCAEIVSLVGPRKLSDPALKDILCYAVKKKEESLRAVERHKQQEILPSRTDEAKELLVYGTIHEAASKGDLADVRRHLARGVAVNARDGEGMTPLYHASRGGKKEIVEYLVGKGADVNAKDKEGMTPLLIAAGVGNKEIVEYLVGKGADVNVGLMWTPLHAAASNGHRQIVEYLVGKGADVNARGRNGWTPLRCAAYKNKEIVEYLVGKGADVNARDSNGGTPLHSAATTGNKEIVEYLIGKGADVNARGQYGLTPLQTASNHKDVAEILRRHGATDDGP